MLPRRPFRRSPPPPPLRRPFLRPPLPGLDPRAREALILAHQAMERGDTVAAARIFHRLAEACARQRMPLRAAGLLMEAAVAEAAGGEANRAAEDGVRALAFSQAPLPERVAASAERLVTTLRQGGHETEAAAVEKALDSGLGSAGTTRQALRERMTAAAQAQRPGRLPARCATCGGPLLPAEVAWHDPDTAECPYCGGVIKAE